MSDVLAAGAFPVIEPAGEKTLEKTVEGQLRQAIDKVMSSTYPTARDITLVQQLSVKQGSEISAPFLKKVDRIKAAHGRLKSA